MNGKRRKTKKKKKKKKKKKTIVGLKNCINWRNYTLLERHEMQTAIKKLRAWTRQQLKRHHKNNITQRTAENKNDSQLYNETA